MLNLRPEHLNPAEGAVALEAARRGPEDTPTVVIDATRSVMMELLNEAVRVHERPMTVASHALLGHKIRTLREIAYVIGITGDRS